jgi:hypothetical protein
MEDSMKEVIVEKVAFEGPNTPDRGYTCRVSYLKAPDAGDALVEIFNAGKIVRHFLFPAYKIYNIQVHFSDIVDGEIANNLHGYEMAAWDGISGAVVVLSNHDRRNDELETKDKRISEDPQGRLENNRVINRTFYSRGHRG